MSIFIHSLKYCRHLGRDCVFNLETSKGSQGAEYDVLGLAKKSVWCIVTGCPSQLLLDLTLKLRNVSFEVCISVQLSQREINQGTSVARIFQPKPLKS